MGFKNWFSITYKLKFGRDLVELLLENRSSVEHKTLS